MGADVACFRSILPIQDEQLYNEIIEEGGECKVLGKLRDSVYHFPSECVRVLHHFILVRCHPHIDKSAEIEIEIEIDIEIEIVIELDRWPV